MESAVSNALEIEAGLQETTMTATTTTKKKRTKKTTTTTRASIGGGFLRDELSAAYGRECPQILDRHQANGWGPASRRFSADSSGMSSTSVVVRMGHASSQVDQNESEKLNSIGGIVDRITRCTSDLCLSGIQLCRLHKSLDKNDDNGERGSDGWQVVQRLASYSGCNSPDSIQADVPLNQDTREPELRKRSPDVTSPTHRGLEKAATCCVINSREDLPVVDSPSVSEKLQHQEAQRKHVILSMAMERLTAKKDVISSSNGGGTGVRIVSDIIKGENGPSSSSRDKPFSRSSNSTTTCELETTLRPPSRRSYSAVGRTHINCDSLSQSAANKCDTYFEALIVESWLDDHPEFVRDYLLRKATWQMIDEWSVANARVSSSNLKGSLLDISSACSSSSRPSSQMSLNPRRPAWVGLATSKEEAEPELGSLRSCRSNSQSAAMTMRERNSTAPMRKISATDFEMRSGSGFLRPMLSKTPDGRCSFLPLINLNCRRQTNQSLSKRLDDVNRSSSSSSTSTLEHGCGSTSALGEASLRDRGEAIDAKTNQNSANDSARDEAGEVRLIFELVKNICDDLDIHTLLYKILKNIAALINADRSSLFLVCGGPNDPKRRLVSQLFNVDQESSCELDEVDEPITIPWGTGLVGYVAASGEAVNIADCYGDPRFTDAIDQRTGYITQHMLCAPIFDKNMEIVGVAQVINKRDGNAFSKSDEIKFKRYLQFCGIGLRNAQSYEQCQLENKRNQVLLDLARMVFEEQSGIEQVVHRIMLHTQSLLDCERCQVLLIDNVQHELDHLLQFSHARGQIQSSDGGHYEELVEGSGGVRPRRRWRPQCCLKRDTRTPEVECCQSPTSEEKDSKTPEVCHQQTGLAPARLFSLVFDLECATSENPVIYDHRDQSASGQRRAFPINIGITSFVANTGETLNIENAHEHERFDPSVDEGSDFRHRSILCMPIRNGQRQIIGVIQLINKRNGQPFNKNDEDLFEAFAIFCGLGIHNTLMYEQVLKVMAKQRVTFEVLSYHATAPLEEAKKLSQEQIPSCFALNLASLKFNDFSLDEQYMLKSCLRFFLDLDLMRRFQIDHLVFCNWILSVQKNYRKVTYHPIVGGDGLKASPVRYHNWRHAFNVSQMMFAILVICESLGELETLALLIACLCHDLDHRGTNNSFQIKSASPLAELYSTSTMEHHHFDQCVMILNSQGNQILSNLSPQEYSRVIMLLEEAILATDLANYFSKRDLFFQLINSDQLDWRRSQQHRSLLRCMLMTACDIAAITKPWPVQKVVADLVMSEFYQQGDIERNELKIEPSDMMNRDKMSQLPDMQIGFIDSICAPIYTAFARLFPHQLEPLIDGCLANRSLWCEWAQSIKNATKIPNSNNLVCDNDRPNDHKDGRACNLLPANDLCISKSSINLQNIEQEDEYHAFAEERVENQSTACESMKDPMISNNSDTHGEPTILSKLMLSGIDEELVETGLASTGSVNKLHRCDIKKRSI